MEQEHPRVEWLRDVSHKLNALLAMITLLAHPDDEERFLAFFRGLNQKTQYLTELSDAYSGEEKEILTVTAKYCKGVPPDVYEVMLNTEILKNAQQGKTAATQMGGRATELRLPDHDVREQQTVQAGHASDPVPNRLLDSPAQGRG